MSDQVNTKALIKALRPVVKETGTAAEVKRALSNQLGLNFATPVWDHEVGRHRKFFKLTSNNPETLDVARVRALLPGVPVAYSVLRDAVVGVIGTVPDQTASRLAPADGVNTDEFITLVKQYADRYEWCSDVEEVLEETFTGLHFDARDDAGRVILTGTYPETLTQVDVRRFVNTAREGFTDTTGVADLTRDISARWLSGTTQASTPNASPATGRNGQYQVTIDTTLTADQLRTLGWSGNTFDLSGLAVRYNGITGRITAWRNA